MRCFNYSAHTEYTICMYISNQTHAHSEQMDHELMWYAQPFGVMKKSVLRGVFFVCPIRLER